MLEHLDKMVEASAQAISNIKFDKVVVWENGGQNGSGGNTASLPHNLARTQPPLMQGLEDNRGLELPATPGPLHPEPAGGAAGRLQRRGTGRPTGQGGRPDRLTTGGAGSRKPPSIVASSFASFHFGLPARERVEALRAAGIVLLATATNLEEGKAIAAAGIDAIVAQGYEAGGHRGGFDPEAPDDRLGTMALTPLLGDPLRLPRIAGRRGT